MKILLDECLPWRIGDRLVGHECSSVVKAGFSGKKNGLLLTLAEKAGYEAFITVDQGIQYEQSFTDRKIAILIIRSHSNKIESLTPHIPAFLVALKSIKPGQVISVG